MTEQVLYRVLKRWPDRRRRIEDLFETNESFCEVCLDFEELAEWIEDRQDSTVGGFETAVGLLESLADEISGFLTADEETGRR